MAALTGGLLITCDAVGSDLILRGDRESVGALLDLARYGFERVPLHDLSQEEQQGILLVGGTVRALLTEIQQNAGERSDSQDAQE